ncbi:hypothetical protein PR048_033445 [Dryococelus australis]|uniref:Uncharacterized protein n=1 Tax=Dryococelus australis TaxID=614101 RepID=A0ABQ9G1J7_9NEOP|nr:hypothetical protein PR048_033445 [Dryococelus australis]
MLATPDIQILRADEDEMVYWSSAGMERRWKMGYNRENSPTSGIAQHGSHVRKFWGDITENQTRFAQTYVRDFNTLMSAHIHWHLRQLRSESPISNTVRTPVLLVSVLELTIVLLVHTTPDTTLYFTAFIIGRDVPDRFLAAPLSDFRTWGSCRTMPLVGEFSRQSPVPPDPSYRRRFTLTSLHSHWSRLSIPRLRAAQISSLTFNISNLGLNVSSTTGSLEKAQVAQGRDIGVRNRKESPWPLFGKPWRTEIRMAGPGIEPGSS